jgi:nucleoside-diphosphate-sugar epimerase
VKVLVTGARGHLGAHACARLALAGWEVVAASRTGKPPQVAFEPVQHPGNLRPLVLDLSSESVGEVLGKELGPEVSVVHLAAFQPPAEADSTAADRSLLIELNVMGTLRLLDAVRENGGARRIVYASTCEVYDMAESEVALSESAATRPLSDYAATKLAGEDHLFSFAAEEGVSGIALRMPGVYGPGQRSSRDVPDFLRSVARGERPKIQGDGRELSAQLHVRDAALGIERALTSRAEGACNLADGEPHSRLELARTALALAGLDGEPELVPAQKARWGYHLSIAKARAELGFEPQVRLAEGMAEELRWLRSLSGNGG